MARKAKTKRPRIPTTKTKAQLKAAAEIAKGSKLQNLTRRVKAMTARATSKATKKAKAGTTRVQAEELDRRARARTS
jgi:hypothetical protein